jgi:hypothetical protein
MQIRQNVGGRFSIVWGGKLRDKKWKKHTAAVARLPFDGDTQQPTKSWRLQWVRSGSDGKLGDEGGVGRDPIFWAVEVLSDKK